MIEQPITQIEPENGVSSGVQYKSYLPGLVSPLEEHSARLERGIRLPIWQRMPMEEKALLIAHRRVRRAEQNLQADAEIRKARRSTRGKRS